MIEYTVKVYNNNTKFWYLNGERHREDGPAMEFEDGTKFWYLNGEQLTKYGEQLTKSEHAEQTNPAVEMTIEEICEALGKKVKVVK
jgi:hypothetical protein